MIRDNTALNCLQSALTIASPMPLLDPVTTATGIIIVNGIILTFTLLLSLLGLQ